MAKFVGNGAAGPIDFAYKTAALQPLVQRWPPFFHHGKLIEEEMAPD